MNYSYDDFESFDEISETEEKALRYIIVFKSKVGLVNRVFSSRKYPLNSTSKILRIFKIN